MAQPTTTRIQTPLLSNRHVGQSPQFRTGPTPLSNQSVNSMLARARQGAQPSAANGARTKVNPVSSGLKLDALRGANSAGGVPKARDLSPEEQAEMELDIERFRSFLKKWRLEPVDELNIIETIRKYDRRDETGSTYYLDRFLLRLKTRDVHWTSGFFEKSAIIYDMLWYELRGAFHTYFKQLVDKSISQKTMGPTNTKSEDFLPQLAKAEAMGLWGMLKGMGTGLVSMAGPEAAQYIGAQFDETAHILFGHEWDSSEPLVLGMNAGQIGTAGGDVIMQLAMFARTAGAKGGKVLQLLNNLDKFKRAQQMLGALGGVQGVLMATKGIAELIDAKRKAKESITADALLHDMAFVNQLVMLLSSGIGIALAIKGAPPSAQQAATRARIGVLLSTVQVTSAVADISRIAQSDSSELEKELAYGQVISGLIPQLVGLIIAGHGHVQAKREATQERQAQAQSQQEAKTPSGVEAPVKTEAQQTAAEPTAAGQAMHAPDEPVPAKKLSAHAALEQARKPIADAHQAQMQDEVKNHLAPRIVPGMPADLAAGLREPLYTPPARGEKSKTIGQPHATLEAARQAYDHVLSETGARVEAGIWQHPDTGEYVVQLGHPTSVTPPDQDTGWRSVQHFHPNTSDVPLWRMPSGADVSGLVGQAAGHGRAATEIVEYPLPNGSRGRAAYTVTTEGKLIVEFIGIDGQRVSKTINKVEDYKGYHPSRKVAADPAIRNEVDQWLDSRRGKQPASAPEPRGQAMHAPAPKKPSDGPGMPAPPQRAAIPVFELTPTSTERLVAVRVQGDSKTKGHYIVGPELPAGQNPFEVDRATYMKSASKDFKSAAKDEAFIVVPESQACAMGFAERGKPFNNAVGKLADSDAPAFTPYKKGGKTLESRHAEPDTHPLAARTSPKKSEAKRKGAWGSTIAPSLQENESYKFQLAKQGELGLKRAGNASEKGADHITVDLSSAPPKIFLNDATTPYQSKKPKPAHKDWHNQFKKDFPVNAKGVRDFGFDSPEINAKINQAFDAGEVYTRTLRPGGVVDVDGAPMREYVADKPVKVGRKSPQKN